MDDRITLEGTKLIVVASIIDRINRLSSEASNVSSALEEEVQRLGLDLLGQQEGGGKFGLGQTERGDLFIQWLPREEDDEKIE